MQPQRYWAMRLGCINKGKTLIGVKLWDVPTMVSWEHVDFGTWVGLVWKPPDLHTAGVLFGWNNLCWGKLALQHYLHFETSSTVIYCCYLYLEVFSPCCFTVLLRCSVVSAVKFDSSFNSHSAASCSQSTSARFLNGLIHFMSCMQNLCLCYHEFVF